MDQIKKSTCYVCLVDDLELVETCGHPNHEVCEPCRIKIAKETDSICPMCRVPIKYVSLEQKRLNRIRFEMGAILTRSIAQNTDAQEFGEQLIENYRQMFGVDKKSRHFETLEQYREYHIIKVIIHCLINRKDEDPNMVPDLEDAQDMYRQFKKIFKDYNVSFTDQSILDVLLANMHLF